MMFDDDLKNAPDRVDGRAKVLGQARFIAEQRFPNTAHGYFVTSAVAKGRIRSIDSTEADKQPGVVAVLSHRNAPKLTIPERPEGRRPYTPFTSDAILFSGQPVAAVIAETFEQARYAASLVRVTYDEQKPETDPIKMPAKGFAAGPDRP